MINICYYDFLVKIIILGEIMTKGIILFKSVLAGTLLSSWLMADITGVVYKDFNFNGVKDSGDTAVTGIPVSAVCEDGLTYQVTTNASGAYTLSGFPAGNKCRVEADPSTAGVGSGPNATGSAPLVDIVADGSTHNISTGSPATYCQANPDVVMAALPGYYTAGKYSTGGGVAPTGFGSVFKVPAPQNGTFNNRSTITVNRTTLANSEDTGAIWGAAWKKGTKALFVAANLKRYVPLKDESSAASVAASAGTIYKIDTTVSPAALSSFTVVPDVLSATAQTELGNRDYAYNKDNNTQKYAAREGLGDLEISEDETKLYTVNMNTKELIVIDANNGNILDTVAIPNPYNNTCDAAMVRPWALKVRGSDVFVGSVCENKIADGVGAAIQKYNGAIFMTIAQTNPLTYLRPRGYGPKNKDQGDGYRYTNWSDTSWANGPILTDIEFTNSGDMVLGYNSRATYNRVASLKGDIRKMCLNADNTYTDESSDVVATDCETHVLNYEGNPTDYMEFYIGDFFGSNHGDGHPETASGALAQEPGASNIIVGMIDGTDWWQPGAIGNYDNITGDKIGAQAIIDNNKIDDGGEREPYGAKAGGMGDVELLCDPAPIEIGNLVWVDGNQDGIQDPNEPGISDVNVTLTCAGVTMGSVVTDANGHYYFGGINDVNLLAGKKITAAQNCQLSLAKADVNGKPPTVTNPNANANDTIDNDASENGANNVIDFITTLSNDHSLDFGITPTIGCVEGQLYNDANNDSTHQVVEAVASNVTLIITDSFGGTYTVTTNASGVYQLTDIPAGVATVKVDTTDTDITEGAVWYSHAFTINVPESTPGTCLVQDARYDVPGPNDQDPKDVAICANPTSLTWEGATVGSMSDWHDMVSNNSQGTAKTFTTAGGTPVNIDMYITDPDAELNNAQAGTYNGAGTLGTDGAFSDPYLTLYLGDQSGAGNGTWEDAANCAVNGYDLISGEKVELVVEFDQKVVLDNWRIRDVDSGDDRSGTANWNWQDGIEVQAFDENSNPVAVETKIGSAGAGLTKGANGIVHTDPATYNGGDVAHGTGTTPDSSNGHIVITSNFVPIKKLIITHVAGPDVPCQTRSALAMAGFAVCKPLHIRGTVFDDDNGVSSTCGTSDDIINGTEIDAVDGKTLNVCLLDANGIVLDTTTLNNGNYDFDSGIHPNTDYKVLLTTKTCIVGSASPGAALSEGWKNEGEAAMSGNDDTVNSTIEVMIVTDNVEDMDFAINKVPTAADYTRASELNPGGTTQVQFDLSGNSVSDYLTDLEDTTPVKIVITAISNGTLYNSGTQVNVGDVITDPDFLAFNIDPTDGDTVAAFEYKAMDNACRVSDNAKFLAPFTTLNISGNLFLDTTRDNQVNGTETATSCDGTTALYANLIDANNVVLSSDALDDDGSYAFHYSDGVRANTKYTIVLSQIAANTGDPVPSAALPTGCENLDGENIESLNPEGTDGTPDGKISVSVETSDVTGINFAITPMVKIGDKVWIEDDNDGNATTGNITPVVGTTVTAVCDGTTYTVQTDANGLYSIDVPVNSNCTVSVLTPADKTPSLGSEDSDVDDTTSENDRTHNPSGTIVSVGTVDNLTVDFGFASVGNWSGHVSEDTNNDDQGDIAIPEVTIELYTDPNCDGNNADGIRVATTTTDSNGDYAFANLIAGCYVAVELQPVGFIDVNEYEGGEDNDQPDNGIINTIAGRVDAGENDADNDFVEEESATAYRIGNLFWIDSNKNGKYDQGEVLISGALIELLDEEGNPVLDENGNPITTITNENGRYHFDVAAGTYRVRFNIPDDKKYEGYVFTSKGDPQNDETNKTDKNGLSSSIVIGKNYDNTVNGNNLRLDGGINCGCDSAPIKSNGGDALGFAGMIGMLFLTLLTAYYFVRKEEKPYV